MSAPTEEDQAYMVWDAMARPAAGKCWCGARLKDVAVVQYRGVWVCFGCYKGIASEDRQ